MPSLYIDEEAVIIVASKLIFIGVLFQLFDGLQVVELGILRGLNDLKVPTYTTIIAYWVIGLPTSYIVGIHFEMGAVGIWIGYLAGLGSASLMLFIRYSILKKRILSSV